MGMHRGVRHGLHRRHPSHPLETSMNRDVFLILSMIAMLTLAGFSFAKSETQSARLGHQVVVVCQEHQALAQIAKETAQTQVQNSKILLPKINLPGLSHQRLVELTKQKELTELRNLGKLEAIARKTC